MPDKKLTDNEIVKALKSRMYKENKYMFSLLQATLDLINRLQAENEVLEARIGVYETCNARKDEAIRKLEAENERLQEAIDEQDIEISRLYKRIDEAKTEAYKEFAERLKK